MKLKNNFTLAGMGGEYVAVPMDGAKNFHGLVKLNESGAEVFRGLTEGQDTEELIQRLMNKYEGLDAETAGKAVAVVIEKLQAAGLMEE